MSWIAKIQKGDILRGPSGLRVVREVSHSVNRWGTRTSVYFAIQRCSWTGRCYTVMNQTDLRTLGYMPTGKHWPLNHAFDQLIEEEFKRNSRSGRVLGCCDVAGVG